MGARLLATDLDRTLLPNGAAPEDPRARPLLAALVSDQDLVLAYVTGRRLQLVEQALEEYSLPRPDYILADVGSTLYEARDGDWVPSRAWAARLAQDWSGREAQDLVPLLAGEAVLELQEPENQGPFKLSFYAPLTVPAEALLRRLRATLAEADLPATVVYSVDEAAGVGLVDVLPQQSSKLRALEFLMAERDLPFRDVVFAGDSGNDLEVLVSPIPAVLVANADIDLRARVLREARAAGHAERVFAAAGGYLGMNGNYAAGILEGWVHYHPADRERLAALARAGASG